MSPTSPAAHPRIRAVAALAVVVATTLATGCAGPPISPTPQPASGIYQQIALHGGAVVSAVAGDPGCTVPGQIPLATHVRLRVPAASAQIDDMYLFVYADRPAFDRQAANFAACRNAYAASAATGGRPVRDVQVSPYRAFGPGWSDSTLDVIRQSMVVAAGNGG